MTDVVFLEYSFNPQIDNSTDLFDSLDKLGFVCRSKHYTSGVEFWVQNRAILLLREDLSLDTIGRISGIGFLVSKTTLDLLTEAYYDVDTDFFRLVDPDNTFNLYLVLDSVLDEHYKSINVKHKNASGVECFSGLVVDYDDNTNSLLSAIAPKVEDSENYKKFIFSNKFTVLLKTNGPTPQKIIAESADVFRTTAYYSLRQINLLPFNETFSGEFGELNHKIVGYNCKAFGNSNSYSIENYVVGRSFTPDIIFRQRKQYLKIKENTLDYYDSIARHQT